MCVFVIFIFFFVDKVLNFRSWILTNQKQEFVITNYLWNCMCFIGSAFLNFQPPKEPEAWPGTFQKMQLKVNQECIIKTLVWHDKMKFHPAKWQVDWNLCFYIETSAQAETDIWLAVLCYFQLGQAGRKLNLNWKMSMET